VEDLQAFNKKMVSKPCGVFISPKCENFLKGTIPLGLLNIASIVKDLVEVTIIDLNLKDFNLDQIVKKKYPIFFAITNNYTINFYNVVRLINELKLKYPKIPIITGGIHSTFDYKNLMNLGVDYVIRHEGEITFKQLVEYIVGNKKRKLNMIKGISYKKDNKLHLNEDRKHIENLDDLPIPDYDLLGKEFKKYYFNKFRVIETSRGCTYNCLFCSDNSMWLHKWRKKTPRRVLKEFIKANKEGAKFILIGDANMSNDPENVKDICNLLIKNKNQIPWWSEHRADTIINNPDLVKLMKTAKCRVIGIGYESMSKRILDYYNKKTTPPINLKALEIIKKSKLISQGGHIIGAPDEKLSEMIKTMMFAFRLDYPNVAVLKSYPNSNLDLEKKRVRNYTNFREVNLYNPLKITGLLQKLFLALAYLNPIKLLTLISRDESIRIISRSTYVMYLNAIKNFLRL